MSAITVREGLLSNGMRVDAAGGRSYGVVDPATAEQIALVAEAGAEDANRAVAAAGSPTRGGDNLSPVTRHPVTCGRTMQGGAEARTGRDRWRR
jgi:acyl-CoA reductase-like NAD-dependent aldehyde dehydrogenase